MKKINLDKELPPPAWQQNQDIEASPAESNCDDYPLVITGQGEYQKQYTPDINNRRPLLNSLRKILIPRQSAKTER